MDLDEMMTRLAVCRVYADRVSAIHANERQEERTARDLAPVWAHEPQRPWAEEL